jgi:hypothetical protein
MNGAATRAGRKSGATHPGQPISAEIYLVGDGVGGGGEDAGEATRCCKD